MQTGKKIGIIAAAVVAVIVIGVVYLWSSLDKLVEQAIEQHGSAVTQTRVDVGDVKLELTSGKGSIQGIRIGNPPGYSAPNIFTLDNISVAVDPKTVTENVIVIDQILVQAPHVFYEINSEGKSNLDALKQNLQQAAPGGDKGDKDGDKIKVVIRKLIIDQGEINAQIAALGGKGLSTNLPRIVLTDIGKDSGGATPGQVATKVTNALVGGVGPAVGRLGVGKYLGKSAEQVKALLEKAPTDSIQGGVKDTVGGLKGLFGN